MARQILFAPSTYDPSAKIYLIFFITGNPGFIAYYRAFLTTLNHLLSPVLPNDNGSSLAFQIFGQSLPGFEDEDGTAVRHSGPYGLQEVIDHALDLLAAQRISAGDRKGDYFDGVILMGHSVGSYILLEILRKIREMPLCESVRVKAGVLLFPTVMELTKSPNGIKFSPFFRIPDFARVFSIIVTSLFSHLPRTAVKWLVETLTRMPEDAASVTTNLLVGKGALWQALHMTRDEMNMITDDRWDEDIWGVEHPDPDSKEAIPKLVFYFGQRDHWVADRTRDSLIASRGGIEGQNSSKPIMMIDQDGIPHAFCLRHGELVAEKVKVWIDEIVKTAYM